MMTVREVAAMREVETKYGIAWLQHGRIGFHVGLRSCVGLHISVLGAKEFVCPLACQIFYDICKLTAPVIAFTRISFGVLIREYRAHGFQHRLANEVFGCDQLETFTLAPDLVVDRVRHLRVCLTERERHSGCGFHFAISGLDW